MFKLFKKKEAPKKVFVPNALSKVLNILPFLPLLLLIFQATTGAFDVKEKVEIVKMEEVVSDTFPDGMYYASGVGFVVGGKYKYIDISYGEFKFRIKGNVIAMDSNNDGVFTYFINKGDGKFRGKGSAYLETSYGSTYGSPLISLSSNDGNYYVFNVDRVY